MDTLWKHKTGCSIMQCLKLVDWWLSETAERFTVDSHFLVKLELGWQKGKNNIWHPRPADKYLYHYITTPEKLSNVSNVL